MRYSGFLDDLFKTELVILMNNPQKSFSDHEVYYKIMVIGLQKLLSMKNSYFLLGNHAK